MTPVVPIPASVVEAITAERDKAKGATKRQAPKDFDVDLAVDAILNADPGERHYVTRSAVMRALWRDEPPETYERLREAFVKSTGGGSDRENDFRGMVEGGKRKVEEQKNRVLSDFAFLTTNPSKPYFYIPNRTEMTAAGARGTAKLSIKEWKMIVAGMKFKAIAEGTGNFPGRTNLLVEHDKVRWINTWARPPHKTPDELPANLIDEMGRAWLQHLIYLFPIEDELRIMLAWTAWIVQHPGERVNWAPYLYTPVKGGGKSIFYNSLMSRLLGAANVKAVTSSAVVDQDWTEWKSGAELCVLEDIDVPARFKSKVAGKFLDAIGNETVSMLIRNKGSVQVPNLQNYILLTNQPDIFPLDDSERRWFYPRVVSGYKEAAYYEKLAGLIDDPDCVAATYEWLNTLPIPDEFARMVKGRAPDSELKRELIKTASGSVVADQIRELIEDENVEHVNRHYIGMTALRDAMKAKELKPGKPYSTIKTLGYDKLPKMKKLDGKSQDIYIYGLEAKVTRLAATEKVDRETAYRMAWEELSDAVENRIENGPDAVENDTDPSAPWIDPMFKEVENWNTWN